MSATLICKSSSSFSKKQIVLVVVSQSSLSFVFVVALTGSSAGRLTIVLFSLHRALNVLHVGELLVETSRLPSIACWKPCKNLKLQHQSIFEYFKDILWLKLLSDDHLCFGQPTRRIETEFNLYPSILMKFSVIFWLAISAEYRMYYKTRKLNNVFIYKIIKEDSF